MNKYERSGAHPEAHYYALSDSLDFLSSIGIDRIRARLYGLTARWLRPAQQLEGFRAAVPLDPAHCAGLVAWEFTGRRTQDVRAVLTKHNLLVRGTESYEVSSVFRQTAREVYSLRTQPCSPRRQMSSVSAALSAIAHA